MSASLANRRLGRTKLEVSPLCFGASGLGDMPDTYGYSVEAERARATLDAIFDGSVNFLDTSRIYGLGRSEARIGEAIRARGGLPNGFVLSTKLDRDPATGRFDSAQARRSVEQSLAALGVSHIDLLHLHDPEHAPDFAEATSREGALGELFRMKEEGLLTAVGLAAGRVDLMMPLIRDWDRNAEAMIDLAVSRGTAVLNAAPYAGGVLAKGSASYQRYVYQEASAEALDPIRRIEAICARHGVPPGAAALQFSLRDPRVTSTVCGVTKPERVTQTLEWARFPIPEALWADLATLEASTDDPEATRDYKLA